MGTEDEKDEHGMPLDKAKLTAKQHLTPPDQAHYYSGMEKAKKAGMLKDALMGGGISSTAIPTPVIGIAVRGSSTGGFPSGMDQTGISPNTPTGRLGGYERIPTAKDNSELVDKTPANPQINSTSPITNVGPTSAEPHAHQVQQGTDEPPQNITGASTDSDATLTLKSAMPKQQKTVDIDVNQEEKKEPNDMDGQESMEDEDDAKAGLNEGKHKAGCKCGFCANKGSFKKKEKKETDEVIDSTSDRDDTGEYEGGSKQKGKVKDKKEKDEVDETFKRHSTLLREKLGLKESRCEDYPCCGHGEGGCPDEDGSFRCTCGAKLPKGSRYSICQRCLSRGSDGDREDQWDDRMDECKTCGCGKDHPHHAPGASHPFTTKWKMDSEKGGIVKLSEAFERMRGLANLGERRVMSSGLWGNINEEGGKWMQDVAKGAEKNHTKGALKKDLGVPEEKKIPTERLESIKKSLSAKAEKGELTDKELTLSRRVNAALNMRKSQ